MPQLDAFGFVVDDMARTLDFYRALGLDVPDTPDEGHVETVLPNGVRIMWDTVEVVSSFDGSFTTPVGSSRSALAFSCADAAEVDAVYQRMTDAGFEGHLAPFDAVWGQRYATLRDPSGIGVDLYAALDA